MEKIRLNQQKRQLLKKEWQHTVYNNMPMQVEEDLKLAQQEYREVRDMAWDGVITPTVEKNFPIADMKVLQRYSTNSGYGRFTDTDSCFYFKPQFADMSESQFSFTMSIDEYLAMYHQDFQSRGHQATIKVEYDETQRQENPHYHKLKSDISHDLKSVATSNGHGEDFALFMEGRNYGWTEHSGHYGENDFGKYRKVVVSGSCHSRCMMLESETDWLMLKQFEKARSGLLNAHRELWKTKYELITDMNSIIDQAKFLGDIEQYWTNVKECVNFENTDIGKELSIVSEQTKTRLSQAMNNIKLEESEKEPTVAVVASGSPTWLIN
jgi:hypothetical protein